ncbi:MAG: hypothetical protein M1830_010574 [Pleopsidium flavum]|nr:MAG: hypothetical protein M1830_010574 [Pleopsidium flavum]
MSSDFHIGHRLSYSGALCTLRYVGGVKGTKGEWLGIEWDDPSRGKHTGEHGGVKYFECKRKSPTAGSFVRPSRPVDQPLGFLQALHQKYASDNPQSSTFISSGKGLERPIEISGKVVEEVGFEKIRLQLARLYELQIVLLDGLCIAGLLSDAQAHHKGIWLKELDRIEESCPKITELDLSRNLIESWGEVAGVCIALSKLKSLRLNGNRFREISLEDDVGSGGRSSFSAYESIKELGLNDTLLSWEDIVTVTSRFKSLTTLSVSSNDFGRLEHVLLLDSLVTLTLEQNAFGSLTSLGPLAELPNLRSLFLRDNAISSIYDCKTSASAEPTARELQFSKSLGYVDLSYNAIARWSFIDDLQAVFPGLTGLRVAHNPLYEDPGAKDGRIMSVDEGYMLTLARLGNLKNLNFSNITKQERTNAEMYYLSRIAKSLATVLETEEPNITSQHRRFAELCETYGPPTVVRTSPSTINPNSLAARLINFTFYCHPSASNESSTDSITRTKEIPRTFDIYRLKGIVGMLFGHRPMGLRLIWETGELDPVAGYEEEWDSSDEEEEEGVLSSGKGNVAGSQDEFAKEGKWVKREVELVDSTREVGFWIEGREAKVRLELR